MPAGIFKGKLYIRSKQCPLCEEAKQILFDVQLQFPIEWVEIDIYSDDELIEKYGLMIPVVEIAGETVQYGRIDKKALIQHILRLQLSVSNG